MLVFWTRVRLAAVVAAVLGLGLPATASEPVAGLAAALAAALERHPAVAGKQAEVAAAGHAVDAAEAERYPTLAAQANRLDGGQAGGVLRLTQPLWTFGRIESGVAVADAGLAAERQGLREVQRRLLEETAAAYARVGGVRARQAVAAANVRAHRELHARIQRRREGLLASDTDVQIAHARLLQAEAQADRLDGELSAARLALEALTRLPVDAAEPVDDALLGGLARNAVLDAAVAESPALAVARARVEVAAAGMERERKSAMPTLLLRAEHDVGDFEGADRSRVALALEASLEGVGLISRGRVAGAAARLEAARQAVEVARNDAREQAERLWISHDLQRKLIDGQALTVAAVEGTVASYLRQYDSGIKSWLEVLNMQREWAEQASQLEALRNEALVVGLRLAAVTGRLDALAGVGDE